MTTYTRRELASLIAAGVAVSAASGQSRSVVRPGVVGLAELRARLGEEIPRDAARKAMAGSLRSALGSESAVAGARQIFAPSDIVGIKVNCLAGRLLSPRPELVEALVDLIADAGVDRNRIIVFERSSRELKNAGFSIRPQGPPYVCVGTDNDYDSALSTSGAIGSCFARLVSARCTALVSFGVVKDHDLSGISAGMKNWYGVIHNPNKYHDNGCDPYIADVARHPLIAGKLRLTVLDGVVAQCHGGPAYRAGSTFDLGLVAASTDPVAVDLWAWQVLEAERARRGLPTLEAAGRPVKYLATAAGHGLGVADPKMLRLVTA